MYGEDDNSQKAKDYWANKKLYNEKEKDPLDGFSETASTWWSPSGTKYDLDQWGGKIPTEGQQYGYEKYGLGALGLPPSFVWWMDEYERGKKDRPTWGDYGEQSRKMSDAMRGWQINAMGRTNEALDAIQQRAQGKNLISEMMMKQAADRIGADAQSAAASAPGGYNPMLARQANQTAAGAQQQLAGQAATAGAQEMQAAQDAYLKGRQQYASDIGGIRSQDFMRGDQDLKRYATDIDRYLKELGHKENLIGQGMNEWQQHRALQAALAAQNANANMPFWQKVLLTSLGALGDAGAQYLRYKTGGATGGPGEGGTKRANDMTGLETSSSPTGGTSDVRAKKGIDSAREDAQELLNALSTEGPQTYTYRPGFGEQTDSPEFGPMAQTLEKAGPLGKYMVGQDEPGGMRYLKQPEMTKGLLTAMAEQQKQIEELKKKVPTKTSELDLEDMISGKGSFDTSAEAQPMKFKPDVVRQTPFEPEVVRQTPFEPEVIERSAASLAEEYMNPGKRWGTYPNAHDDGWQPTVFNAGGYDPPIPPAEQAAFALGREQATAGGYDPPIPPAEQGGIRQPPPSQALAMMAQPVSPGASAMQMNPQMAMGPVPQQPLAVGPGQTPRDMNYELARLLAMYQGRR